MKQVISFLIICFILTFLACGGSGGSAGGGGDSTEVDSSETDPITSEAEEYSAEVRVTSSELPTCNSANEGKLYYVEDIAQFEFCNGSSYQNINLTGQAGNDGKSIVWKGALNTAPSNPEVNCSYYNTIDRIAYIWDGDSWEILSQDGADGISILWKGSLASAPSNPEINWAYYNTVDGKSYIWDGDSWEVLAQDGVNGISIVWQGSSVTTPSNPQANWAYYNSTDKTSYIWDGNSWEILSKDGISGGSLSVNSLIAPGSFLSLKHNLNRDNLTFIAQFIKDGYIYNWNDYQTYFATELLNNPYYDYSSPYNDLLRLSNDNFIIAYIVNSSTGVIDCYSSDGSKLYTKWNVFEGSLQQSPKMTLTLQKNNTFIITTGITGTYSYNDQGYFYIFDEAGNTVKDKTMITPTSINITDIDAASLDNGTFIVVYRNKDEGYRGEFIIFSEDGVNIINGPVVFSSNMAGTELGVKKLNNGNIIIYDNSSFIIFDQTGSTIITGRTEYCSSPSGSSYLTVLNDNNFVIAYREYDSPGSSFYNGKFVIYNESGTSKLSRC